MSHVEHRLGLPINKFWCRIEAILIFWKLFFWSMNYWGIWSTVILSELPHIWHILEELFKRIDFFFRDFWLHPTHFDRVDNFVNEISFNGWESVFFLGFISFCHWVCVDLNLIAVVLVLHALIYISSLSYFLYQFYLVIS